MRFMFALVCLLSSLAAGAQVKVAGREIVPKGLIFGEADARSRVGAEDELSDGCSWELQIETRFAEERDDDDCVLDYRRTTVTLTKKCPAPASPEATGSERVTTASRPRCPSAEGEIPERDIESKVISFGRIPDGRQQAIFVQADGTRITLTWSDAAVRVVSRYPDGTTDTLASSAAVEEEEDSPGR